MPHTVAVTIIINQCTTDKLIEMRLTAISDTFQIQINDSAMKGIPFENRFGMLLDVEHTSRKNNHLKRLKGPPYKKIYDLDKN